MDDRCSLTTEIISQDMSRVGHILPGFMFVIIRFLVPSHWTLHFRYAKTLSIYSQNNVCKAKHMAQVGRHQMHLR